MAKALLSVECDDDNLDNVTALLMSAAEKVREIDPVAEIRVEDTDGGFEQF